MAGKRDEPNVERSGTIRDTKTPGGPGVNPFHDAASGGTGGVNTSGPATGTEGWGIGPGEADTTGVPQGSLGSSTFRCSDMGNTDCRWEVSGDEDLLPQIERHAREHHGLKSVDDSWRRKILDVIRNRRAA